MRHSGVVIDKGNGIFETFHLRGTPGVGLTFDIVSDWRDPRTETARLLSMEFVAWIPTDRYAEVAPLLRGLDIKISMEWNCQDWVRDGLDEMVAKSLISPEERDSAVWKQRQAISMPFTTETPNVQALQDQ